MFSYSALSISDVESVLNKRVSHMQEINTIVAGAIVDIHDVLTPEQLSSLASIDFSESSHTGEALHHRDRMHNQR